MNVAEVCLCFVASVFAGRSKMEFETRLSVKVSVEIARESRLMTSVYTLSYQVMLVGVAELNPAVPPEIVRAKSVTSNSPVPFETA